VEAAARSLAAQIPTLPPGQRKTLAEHLLEFLQSRNQKKLSSASEAAMLRVLAALHERKAEEIFWARLDAARPPAIRAASLQALGALPPPTSEARLKKLLDCALADDFQIVAPALLILKNIAGKKAQVKSWLRLVEAPDVATRRFAVEKLKEIDSPEVARALLPQIRHPDRALRDETLGVLRGSVHGRKVLLEALLSVETTEEAWPLARALAATAPELPTAQRTRLWTEACKHHDANDRRDEPLWFLLRETDASWTRDQIEQRALELRKKKKYAESLSYWRLLTRDPACSEEIRFEQAATGIKVSDHDTAALARQGNPYLGQFARLLQDAGFDLAGHVKRAKWLDVEDLYYLGFHFAGEKGPARKFGQQVLELVMKKSPRSELGKSAKRKLKSEGLSS
jgi:HEAT repeat protein